MGLRIRAIAGNSQLTENILKIDKFYWKVCFFPTPFLRIYVALPLTFLFNVKSYFEVTASHCWLFTISSEFTTQEKLFH